MHFIRISTSRKLIADIRKSFIVFYIFNMPMTPIRHLELMSTKHKFGQKSEGCLVSIGKQKNLSSSSFVSDKSDKSDCHELNPNLEEILQKLFTVIKPGAWIELALVCHQVMQKSVGRALYLNLFSGKAQSQAYM